jgi:hypothetical protein
MDKYPKKNDIFAFVNLVILFRSYRLNNQQLGTRFISTFPKMGLLALSRSFDKVDRTKTLT